MRERAVLFCIITLFYYNLIVLDIQCSCEKGIVVDVLNGKSFDVDVGQDRIVGVELEGINVSKPDDAKAFLELTILNNTVCLDCEPIINDSLGRTPGCMVYKVMPNGSLFHQSINTMLLDYGFAELNWQGRPVNLGAGFAKSLNEPVGSGFMAFLTSGINATVTIKSTQFKGYDVKVDGNYVGTDGKGGDTLDGVYSFNVTGNQQHIIRADHPMYWKYWQIFCYAGKQYFFDLYKN